MMLTIEFPKPGPDRDYRTSEIVETVAYLVSNGFTSGRIDTVDGEVTWMLAER